MSLNPGTQEKTGAGWHWLRRWMTQAGEKHHHRLILLLTADALAIAASYFGAFVICYAEEFPRAPFPQASLYLPLQLIAGLSVFTLMRMYRTLWRYASVDAITTVVYACTVAIASSAILMNLWGRFVPHWSVLVVQWMLLVLLVGGGRISIRVLRQIQTGSTRARCPRLLIYGAGDAGEMIARDILKAPDQKFVIVGFIDDSRYKQSKSLHGLPIFGGMEVVADVVRDHNVDEIIVAMPSIPGSQMRVILNHLRNVITPRIKLKTLPGIAELIQGTVTLQQVRNLDVRDLLRRSPVVLDAKRVERLLQGKSVLVSGAGGSIGSEVCRQVAATQPARLVLFDVSEPSLYEVLEELTGAFPNLEVIPVVGSICNAELVRRVFQENQPKVVFHAAAYKHVPLMEANPGSAVFNNVMGTKVLLAAAATFDVDRFVMISTDKAVRPTSIMGATKRICEMLVQRQRHRPDSVYCVVRFGNVMGSSGSVIPKFEKQIRSGGPVTVTHPEVTRFFMLTSEAVQLVMQAASLNHSDAIYILDMGEPIKIDDLARDMIHLYGYEPGREIPIVYTGLRPGEKLHEELYHSGTGVKTEVDKIWLTDAPPNIRGDFDQVLDDLLAHCYELPREHIARIIATLVPDFKWTEPGTVSSSAYLGSNGKKKKATASA